MKYLKLFELTSQYEEYINSTMALLPNVSFVQETPKVFYNPFVEIIDYSQQYLTFEAIEDSTFQLTENACEYSLDEGATWTSLSAGTNTPTVSAANKIMFKATNPTISSSYGIGTFSSTGKFNVEGNIMSLLYGDNFKGQASLEGKSYAFFKLFYDCTGLIDTSNLILPATTLADYCYALVFAGCTSITTAPEFPATTLAEGCYTNMFRGCTSLTTAPELPATTLSERCYKQMFKDCTSLTKAPELPATKLAIECYSNMFRGCTSLTTAPELPATTLSERCYQSMFSRCTSLTTAPELPATTLVNDCYSFIFYGCTNLSHITMLATKIPESDYLYNWVSGVSSTGTFVKHSDMDTLPTGTSGIPEGWTVQNAA